MNGTLVDRLNRLAAEDDTKLKFDVNATKLNQPKIGCSFTLAELEALAGAHPEIGMPCTLCHLPVPKWGWAWYIFDESAWVLVVEHHICKACWKYSQLNPLFDYAVDTIHPPSVSSQRVFIWQPTSIEFFVH